MGSIGIFDFCGEKHEVHLSVQDGSSFRVRVRNNTKSWANTFNVNYIEQLTRKTGSYKEFSVFITMLSAAINNPGTNGLSLELLTPFDLDALRVNKENNRNRQPIGDRRYLLLVTVDSFSRIHYPLSLPVEESLSVVNPMNTNILQNITQQNYNPAIHHHNTGKLNPSNSGDTHEIHSIVKQLQEEIHRLKAPSTTTFRDKYEEMLRVNEGLKEELEEARSEIHSAKNTKIQKHMKKMMEHMEQNLTEEKARFKKVANEQKRKIKLLESELEETKTDNKSLEIRIRALNNELAVYKKSKTAIGSRGRPVRQIRPRDSSRDSKRSTKSSVRQSRPPLYSRPTSSSKSRSQIRSRDTSPCGSVRSVASSVGSRASLRSGTSVGSNNSTRRPRFDPTAYIAAKKAKELENKRNMKSRRSTSQNSRKSSDQNLSNASSRHNSRFKSGINRTKHNRASTPDPLSVMTSDDEDYHERNKQSTVEDSLIRDGSFNIHEIDARLSALQQYMNDLATH